MSLIIKMINGITLLLFLALLLWFVFSAVRYRLVNVDSRYEVVGEVQYKMVEVTLNNRSLFEGILGNKPIRLVDKGMFFVSEKDKKKLWPESPFDMERKQYTIKARITLQKLLFGGGSVAKVVEVEKINQRPIRNK
ncbi:hypothetical protein FLL45_22585 [Aliikangiella marina]|uniref:Uncharacterized protein n=1 Tax=Aliikangiella marina TaxID=1712262 RepID=A0A545T1L0_9GAMM|nr:hypothetical protein [Aliikangiella marina]TQV71117.1 hypothetical protein FLL45_22585 [Aliikangiella marina]